MKGSISSGLRHSMGIGFLLFTFLGQADAGITISQKEAKYRYISLIAEDNAMPQVARNGGLTCGGCNDPENRDECQELSNKIENGTVSNPPIINNQTFCYRCASGIFTNTNNSIFRFFGCMGQNGTILGKDGQPIAKVPNVVDISKKLQFTKFTAEETFCIVMLCDYNLCNIEKNIPIFDWLNLSDKLAYLLVSLAGQPIGSWAIVMGAVIIVIVVMTTVLILYILCIMNIYKTK